MLCESVTVLNVVLDTLLRPFMKCRIINVVVVFCVNVLRLMFIKRSRRKIRYDEESIEKGNAYIDKLLKCMFDDKLEEYDPYRIEDSVVGFNKTIAFVNVSGEVKLHDGYIRGLKTLHRPNHCSLTEDGRLNVKADLGVGVLDFHYSGTVTFMNLGPAITVHGTVAYMDVHIEFNINSETGREGMLNEFIIDDMRGMKVYITGLGPLNWVVNPIVSCVTKILESFLRNFLESKVKNYIAERIPNFQFPIEGVDITDDSRSCELTERLTTIEETIKTESENGETEVIMKIEIPQEPEDMSTERESESPKSDETETKPLQHDEPEIDETQNQDSSPQN